MPPCEFLFEICCMNVSFFSISINVRLGSLHLLKISEDALMLLSRLNFETFFIIPVFLLTTSYQCVYIIQFYLFIYLNFLDNIILLLSIHFGNLVYKGKVFYLWIIHNKIPSVILIKIMSHKAICMSIRIVVCGTDANCYSIYYLLV